MLINETWYNKNQLKFESGGPKDIEMMFDLEELTEFFGEFEILIAQNSIRNIKEGKLHNGKSSVVQFLAKKI